MQVLLRQFAGRLAIAGPEGTLVARIGTNQFAMLLRGVEEWELRRILTQVNASLTTPLVSEGQRLFFTLSGGYSLIDSETRAGRRDADQRSADGLPRSTGSRRRPCLAIHGRDAPGHARPHLTRAGSAPRTRCAGIRSAFPAHRSAPEGWRHVARSAAALAASATWRARAAGIHPGGHRFGRHARARAARVGCRLQFAGETSQAEGARADRHDRQHVGAGSVAAGNRRSHSNGAAAQRCAAARADHRDHRDRVHGRSRPRRGGHRRDTRARREHQPR